MYFAHYTSVHVQLVCKRTMVAFLVHHFIVFYETVLGCIFVSDWIGLLVTWWHCHLNKSRVKWPVLMSGLAPKQLYSASEWFLAACFMHILLDVVDAHYLFLLRAKSVTSQNILSLRYKLQANRSHFVVLLCVSLLLGCVILSLLLSSCVEILPVVAVMKFPLL